MTLLREIGVGSSTPFVPRLSPLVGVALVIVCPYVPAQAVEEVPQAISREGKAMNRGRGFWSGSAILDCAFSPDGRWIAFVSAPWSEHFPQNSLLSIGEASTGKLRHVKAGHPGGTTAVAFSSDGKSIATGGVDRKLRIWDSSSGELTKTIGGPRHALVAVEFSPDSSMLAGLDEGSLMLWTISPSATELVWSQSIEGELALAQGAMAFASGGESIFFAPREGPVIRLSADAGKIMQRYGANKRKYNHVAVTSREGQMIAAVEGIVEKKIMVLPPNEWVNS
jgi:hypothetical protein